jgi:hypothetical protein
MSSTKRSVRQSYIELRGLSLGVGFLRENGLQPGQKYPFAIDGLDNEDAQGTLSRDGFIGGLAILYNAFDLKDGDQIDVSFDGSVIRLAPPPEKRKKDTTTTTTSNPAEPLLVFEKQRLKRIHIEPFAPGNLSSWVPQTEADVYMVFGVLSEYTDYRYTCGASKFLLDKLGYSAETKPDAILIDRRTDEYVMAEFKMSSKEFALNHKAGDVDVLICWEHNEMDASKLPPRIVGLRTLLEKALRDGEISL